MNNRHAILPTLAAAFLLAPTALAGPGREAPRRYVPALDGTPVTVELRAEGIAIAAWAYRSGPEYDLAISIRDASGSWDAPVLIGAGDGLDQVDPAIAFDAVGTTYVVYALRPAGSILLTERPAGSESWTAPREIAPSFVRASDPSLLIVGDQLVVAFRTARGTAMVTVPVSGAAGALGIQDGPDGVDPLGAHGDSGAQPIGGS